jgi:hypothetical protein
VERRVHAEDLADDVVQKGHLCKILEDQGTGVLSADLLLLTVKLLSAKPLARVLGVDSGILQLT